MTDLRRRLPGVVVTFLALVVVCSLIALALDFSAIVNSAVNARRLSGQQGARGVLQQIVLFTIVAGILIPSIVVVAAVGRARVEEARRELARWRLAGASPVQLGWAIYLQSVAVGFTASMTGWCVAVPLSMPAADGILSSTDITVRLEPTLEFWTMPGTVFIAMSAVIVGTIVPARRASKVSPMEALRLASAAPARLGVTRRVVAVVVSGAVVGLTASLLRASDNSSASAQAIALGAVLLTLTAVLAPWSLPVTIAAWTRLIPQRSAWYLARHAACRNTAVATAAVVPASIAAGLTGTYFAAAATWAAGTGQSEATLQRLQGQAVVLFLPAVVVACAGTLAVIFATTVRRSRDVALLEAVGASPSTLRLQPLFEAIIYAVTAAILSIVSAFVATFVYSLTLVAHGAPWTLRMSVVPELVIGLFTMVVVWGALQSASVRRRGVRTTVSLTTDA